MKVVPNVDPIIQGDIAFRMIEIDNDQEYKKQNDGIIARGEVTGHTHALRQNDDNNVLMSFDKNAFVQVRERAYIDHDEHDTVILPSGNWGIFRQEEYTPEGWRTVAD